MSQNIVEVAKQFVGTKEIGNNHGFDNPYFEVLLTRLGWQRGASWCAYSAMLKWYLYYQGQDAVYAKIKHVLHPHVRTMWQRAVDSQVIKTGQLPMIGAIACWAVGVGDDRYSVNRTDGAGHCGVVVDVLPDGTFVTVEGNTSDKAKGSQNNGDGEYEKVRNMKSSPKWKLLGFIYLYKP